MTHIDNWYDALGEKFTKIRPADLSDIEFDVIMEALHIASRVPNEIERLRANEKVLVEALTDIVGDMELLIDCIDKSNAWIDTSDSEKYVLKSQQALAQVKHEKVI